MRNLWDPPEGLRKWSAPYYRTIPIGTALLRLLNLLLFEFPHQHLLEEFTLFLKTSTLGKIPPVVTVLRVRNNHQITLRKIPQLLVTLLLVHAPDFARTARPERTLTFLSTTMAISRDGFRSHKISLIARRGNLLSLTGRGLDTGT